MILKKKPYFEKIIYTQFLTKCNYYINTFRKYDSNFKIKIDKNV